MKGFSGTLPHRWITPKAKCCKSAVHGIGIVAVRPISRREIVGVLGGIVVSLSEIGKYRKKFGHIGIQIYDNFFICPTSREELEKTRGFNHSCNPNIGYLNSVMFAAIRDIKLQEELTFDYAFSETYFEPFKCNCGSENCRKIIKPTDWKIPKIRKKFRDCFSPYLKTKILQQK